MKIKEFNLSEKIEELKKDLSYALNKFDWAHSCLDAQAITILNEWAKRLDEIEKEFIKRNEINLGKLLSKGNVYGEELRLKIDDIEEYRQEIDKLAGEKLNE